MGVIGQAYDQLHRTHRWAYGRQADSELMEAIAGLPRGRAVDLGGGQGRHALALAAEGFDVEVVDSCESALDQLARTAGEEALKVRTTRANLAFYEPTGPLQLVVGALVFHVPARHAARGAAEACGRALAPGGIFYLSIPGYSKATRVLVDEVLSAAHCTMSRCINHVVTPEERPRLGVPRRNETRVLGCKT